GCAARPAEPVGAERGRWHTSRSWGENRESDGPRGGAGRMGRRRWARRLPGSAGGRDARRPVGRNRAARRGGGGAADTPGVDGINNGGTGGGPGTSGAPGGQELRADRPV